MDKNGNIVSDPIMGSNDLEGWKAAVEEQLKELDRPISNCHSRGTGVSMRKLTQSRWTRTCTGSGGRPDDGIWNITVEK